MDGIVLGVQGSELSLAAISSFGASCRSRSLGASQLPLLLNERIPPLLPHCEELVYDLVYTHEGMNNYQSLNKRLCKSQASFSPNPKALCRTRSAMDVEHIKHP